MAWPTGSALPKRIMDNLVATAQSIAGAPNYKSTLKTVKVAGKDAFRIDVFPAATFVPPRISYSDDTLGILKGTMTIPVALVVRSDLSTVPDELGNLVEDFRRAILTDITRATVARDTHVTSSEPYALMEGEPIYGADLTVTVDYAQDSTDPTIPR